MATAIETTVAKLESETDALTQRGDHAGAIARLTNYNGPWTLETRRRRQQLIEKCKELQRVASAKADGDPDGRHCLSRPVIDAVGIACASACFTDSQDSKLYVINPVGEVLWALPVSSGLAHPAFGPEGVIYLASPGGLVAVGDDASGTRSARR